MGVRLSASPNLFGPVINQDYYGDTSPWVTSYPPSLDPSSMER